MTKEYNGGQWTRGKFDSYIKATLRKGTMRWPPKFAVLNAAKRGKLINPESGRLAEHYECEECHKLFPAKNVVVDHIDPIVPITGFISWDSVIERMFCEADGLQVLCKPCHKEKTQIENKLRKASNKNKEEHHD